MYQRAKSLQDLISDPSTFIYLAEEQLEAYMVAINALSLLERRNAWIAMPIVHNVDRQVKMPTCFDFPFLIRHRLISDASCHSIYPKPDTPLELVTQKL